MATTDQNPETTSTASASSENLPTTTDTANKAEQADAIIKRYALFGTATGLIPFFGLDVAAMTAIQVKMIKELANVYEYDIDDQMIRMTITTGVTSLAGRLVTGVLTSITKAFSPLKFLIGGATQAALSGFLTAETGKIYQARMSSGENPADITVSEIVNHVVAQIQQGEWNPTKVAGFRNNFSYLMDNKESDKA
ncbi:hypothetical protein LEM8419_00302 [Neolewinella maritima]|uniref:DUF697 domain-containing protein n=1 Tax=Neolewinella maritima TaxID=1383882 RepID=A0ABM9AWC7_9BACT|nr:YcjF family protein [Neolewinella maritima]CAH0999009.1 hypothetical protein LEM8419_00302 [Neolewinella maritima]